MKINLRESLNKIDLATNNKYDLLNTFDSKKLSDNSKKKLAEAIENNSMASINKVLHESEEKVFTVKVYQNYPFVAEVIDNSIIDKNGEGKVLKKFTNRDALDAFANELISKGYVNYQGYSKNKSLRESEKQLFKVVIQSGAVKRNFESALYEDEAEEIVDYYGGRWIDENGFEWNMYVEEDDESVEHAYEESLNESIDPFIDIFHRGSEEYFKLDKVASWMTYFSPNKVYYAVEQTYFDYGQDWKWTTIIAYRPNSGDSWQAINPRQQESILLCTTDEELEEIAKDILRKSRLDKGFDESLTEASYGGAYDIEDDMFFTKEEIVDFVDGICTLLNNKFGYQYDIEDVWMDTPTKLHISIYDSTHDFSIDGDFRIDMRRIKRPQDLVIRYTSQVFNVFEKKFEDEYQYYNFDESLNKKNLKEDLSDLDLILNTPVDTKQFNEETFRALKNLVSEYKKDLNSLDQWASENEKEPFVKKWYKLADKCKEIANNGIRGITGYGRLNDFVKLKVVDLARSVDNTFPWYTRNNLAKFNELESLQEKLNNREKNSIIKSIINAEEDELQKIINEVYFYDRALYLKLRHFIKKNSLNDKKDYLIKILQDSLEESLTEDTIKQNGKWVNKGSEGTHGKFRTKKAADAQRKAMFANGYKSESLNEQKYSSGNYFLTVDETGMGLHYSLYYQHPHSDYDGLTFIVDGYGYDNFKEKLSKFKTIYPNKDVQNLLKNIKKYVPGKEESLKEQVSFPGYAVKYTTGYSGNGVNSDKTEWFRTEEERDRRVKELKDKNYTEIKTWKMDNFYHTLPKEECLEESNMSYVKKAFAFDIYKDGDKYVVINGDGDAVYESDNTLDCLKWAKKNSSKGYDFNNKFNFSRLKEDIDDEIDLDYETDFDDDGVEEGNVFTEGGIEYAWIQREAGPLYLDFDKWAVWSAREYVNPDEFITLHDNGNGYDFDSVAFKKKAMAAPIVYFVVEEDTGFIDWGPVEDQTEAQDFLNSKVEDWEKNESLNESKKLNESYLELDYEDIDGDGTRYTYKVDEEDVLDYLKEYSDDYPEEMENFSEEDFDAWFESDRRIKWIEENLDMLFKKYEYEILNHFLNDAKEEYFNEYGDFYKQDPETGSWYLD